MTTYRERHLAGHYGGEVEGGKTKAELQDELAALGLPTSGNKPDLEKRLAEAQAAPPAEGDEE